MAAIFTAVKAFDVEALRREIAAGVDPNIFSQYGAPLHYAVIIKRPFKKRLQERLECISVLLEAGAAVDLRYSGLTPLHYAAGNKYAAYQAVIAMLLEAGADPNFTDTYHRSVLVHAAAAGTAGAVRMLISAGAVDLDRALKHAIANGKQRSCTLLLRAGAAIPAGVFDASDRGPRQTRAYIEKIRAAGGYKAYVRVHRQRLVAIFLPKLPHLPHLLLGRVLEFSYDVGSH
jgi:ankyrin repeat protein